jgi:hypothetical protein
MNCCSHCRITVLIYYYKTALWMYAKFMGCKTRPGKDVAEWKRVGKDNAAYLFFATQPFATELIMSNLKMFRYDLIWYKALGTDF